MTGELLELQNALFANKFQQIKTQKIVQERSDIYTINFIMSSGIQKCTTDMYLKAILAA